MLAVTFVFNFINIIGYKCKQYIFYICNMNAITIAQLEGWYPSNFENKLKGRRIIFDDIAPLIKKLPTNFKREIIGASENNIPIYKITIGTGALKVFTWSQMHGNESTGTKALFDLFKYLNSNTPEVAAILKACTLVFVPLLNPDGALKFTRENANGIDLNRDALARKAVESRLLRTVLESCNPKFCFNLHDQRNIFNVAETKNPATLSFLAPSEDANTTLTAGRKETMSVIVAINQLLQQCIPNQIGLYTDEFYPTATGDNFQKLGHNTILIEAGHFKNDINREITRKFNFYALVQGLYYIATAQHYTNYAPYFEIPKNATYFLDSIYKNVNMGNGTLLDVGTQLKFKLVGDKLVSYECIEKTGDLSAYATYHTVYAENLNISKLKLSNS